MEVRKKLPNTDCKIRRADGVTICLVTIVTLTHDLAVAVFVGIFFSSLMSRAGGEGCIGVCVRTLPSLRSSHREVEFPR